jgi:S-formylglutathione hydrolase FrmB
MRCFVGLSTSLLALLWAAPPPALAGGKVEARSFRSASLGAVKRYLVYLPEGYEQGTERYPVIYLLHGASGDETSWDRDGRVAEQANFLDLRALVVMPDADTGFYANWSAPFDLQGCLRKLPAIDCVEKGNYEDYVVKDLVKQVDERYRTVPDRKARALTGNSMGGFGALMLAMRNPDVFSAAASHSGMATLLYLGPHPYTKKDEAVLAQAVDKKLLKARRFGDLLLKIFGNDIARWREHDPAALATKLKDGELALYLDCGAQDSPYLKDGAAYFHDLLESEGVGHEFQLVPGKHDWKFWRVRVGASLSFHADHFRRGGVYPSAK